ncbi:hypothetical protein JIN84_17370 [Luteolibacter yonseiensis]|uniref:Uncharacterized protein n=1 Tax=Luteolibacter yonseiensis TaxID=1144680 RepID=A0A934R5M2_9BACT|nr:hypothetical protein [Luteolibacter yonseiensis]MBK1817394.1 hypothetical protein [Luteolibacter yonseiensis]
MECHSPAAVISPARGERAWVLDWKQHRLAIPPAIAAAPLYLSTLSLSGLIADAGEEIRYNALGGVTGPTGEENEQHSNLSVTRKILGKFSRVCTSFEH